MIRPQPAEPDIVVCFTDAMLTRMSSLRAHRVSDLVRVWKSDAADSLTLLRYLPLARDNFRSARRKSGALLTHITCGQVIAIIRQANSYAGRGCGPRPLMQQ